MEKREHLVNNQRVRTQALRAGTHFGKGVVGTIYTNHEIQFSPEKCVGCKLCYKACFVDVIRWDEENRKPVFQYAGDCEHCFYCQAVCARDAIRILPDYGSEHMRQSFGRYA